jgi:hypothetical protein
VLYIVSVQKVSRTGLGKAAEGGKSAEARGNEMTGERTALQKRGESEAFGPYVNRHFFVHIVFDFLVVDSTS